MIYARMEPAATTSLGYFTDDDDDLRTLPESSQTVAVASNL
jgi:hypothetical protein